MATETTIVCPLYSMPDNRAYAGSLTTASSGTTRFTHDISVTFDMTPFTSKRIIRIDSVRWKRQAIVAAAVTTGSYLPSTPQSNVRVTYRAGGITQYITYSLGTKTLDEDFTGLFSTGYISSNRYVFSVGLTEILVPAGTTSSIQFYSADNELVITGEFETYAPLAPTYLSPTTPQNPQSPITIAWIFNNQPGSPFVQTGSEIEYTERYGQPTIISIDGAINQYTFPADTFVTQQVTFRVRNRAGTEWSPWSEYASFYLTNTPPLAPTLIFPLNVSTSGVNGVLLEWRYNSPFDTFPTRFDIRYNRDGGAWIYLRNDSFGSNPAYQSAMTNPIITQDKVTWQVMAYGALGDAGPWSELGTFFTIGVPDAPIIVRVSNTNRPTIYFSAENLMSWELEIRQNDIVIYQTGSQAFLGDFQHQANQFFINGNYLVRMRVTNEYGLVSEWGMLPFTLNTIAPIPLKLTIVDNPKFNIRLHFDNTEKTVYIYRSELRKNNFLRIAMTKENVFDDFTARPRQRYEYFVRVVNPDDSFADSNLVNGWLSFIQTTIAEYTTPQNMLMFLYAMDGQPTKDETFDFEVTFTNFVGREKPVAQIGNHSSLSQSYSFYCKLEEYEKLKQLKKSQNILILRDWRLGVVYGKINGSISATRELKGMNVSFVFTQTDFDEEVELI